MNAELSADEASTADLLGSLESTDKSIRIPAVHTLRERRLQDPSHIEAVVAMWQLSDHEHVRAGALEVLAAVAPQMLAPYIATIIDSLADPTSSFARLSAVGILQKMQGHGLLTPEVLREHDARLLAALSADQCDDAVRDLVANEIMTVAFAPGSLGAASASQSFHTHAGGAGSSGGGAGSSSDGVGGSDGACGDSPLAKQLEQLRAVLMPEVPESVLLGLLAESGGDINYALNLYMSAQHGEEPPGLSPPSNAGGAGPSGHGYGAVAEAQLDGTLPQHPLAIAMRVASGSVAVGHLNGTLPQHPLTMRVATGTIATVAEGQLDGTLPQDPSAVRVVVADPSGGAGPP